MYLCTVGSSGSGVSIGSKYVPPHLRNRPSAPASTSQHNSSSNTSSPVHAPSQAPGHSPSLHPQSSSNSTASGSYRPPGVRDRDHDRDSDGGRHREERSDRFDRDERRDDRGEHRGDRDRRDDRDREPVNPRWEKPADDYGRDNRDRFSRDGGGSRFGASDIRRDDGFVSQPRREFSGSSFGGDRGGDRGFSGDVRRGFGSSNRSRQPTMERDERLERELFADVAKKTGIEFKNYEDIPVETSGDNVPPPINTFAEMEIHEVLKSNIELSGYDHPTPVQKYGLPIALAGRDVMACAQTGSGKTAAFLFPVIQLLLNTQAHLRPEPQERGGSYSSRSRSYPSSLVLAPTRELATQIYNESRKFVYRTGIRPVVVYGGQDIKIQLREIERGVCS